MNGTLNRQVGQIFLVLSILITIVSCTDHSKKTEIFKSLEESLIYSSRYFDNSSKQIFQSLQDKLYDPGTAEKAKIWLPKIEMIKSISEEMVGHIDSLKNEAYERNGLSSKQATELYQRLNEYKSRLLQISPSIMAAFEKNVIVTTSSFDSSQHKGAEFFKRFFDEVPKEFSILLLDKFENNVRINENKMTLFCYEQTSEHIHICDWPSPIVGINSTYVQAGESLEITAGIGSFSRRSSPEIKIKGRKIPLNNMDVAITKFSASEKPGKHYVPVSITYTDQDGRKITFSKVVEYTVADTSSNHN